MWKSFFPTWRCAFLMRGCFPMCRVRFFLFLFLPPWTHVVPLEEFLRGFVPQNPVPSCLCLLPVPLPGDPGSDVFTYSDPWPPDNTGWYLGSSKEITGPLDPTPRPPLRSMFLPPRHRSGEARSPWRPLPSIDSTDFLLEGREICASQHCLETYLPMVQDTFH